MFADLIFIAIFPVHPALFSLPQTESVPPVINYQNTNIITFDSRTIILDPHGWWTRTTKRRMNQASDQHRLGFWVYQTDGRWYVDYDGRTKKTSDIESSSG